MNETTGAAKYGEEYLAWKDWEAQGFGRFENDDARYFAAETAIEKGAAVRVLELGFGNGAFLGWLKSMGAEVFGVEANPRLVECARGMLGADRAFTELNADELQRRAGSFTHVVAFDVLEHVPQDAMAALLAQLGALLTPDGRIIARFPNGDSPFGRIHQHGDPTHVTTIGRSKLEFFAGRAGLRVLEMRNPAIPTRGAGLPLRLRLFILRALRSVFERVIGVLYYGGQRVAMHPNYVAVLAKRTANTGN